MRYDFIHINLTSSYELGTDPHDLPSEDPDSESGGKSFKKKQTLTSKQLFSAKRTSSKKVKLEEEKRNSSYKFLIDTLISNAPKIFKDKKMIIMISVSYNYIRGDSKLLVSKNMRKNFIRTLDLINSLIFNTNLF
jgi:hypothetical protein